MCWTLVVCIHELLPEFPVNVYDGSTSGTILVEYSLDDFYSMEYGRRLLAGPYAVMTVELGLLDVPVLSIVAFPDLFATLQSIVLVGHLTCI